MNNEPLYAAGNYHVKNLIPESRQGWKDWIFSFCSMIYIRSYTAKRLAGPSKTAVSPSTATTPASLAAYLESPLLYSFPGSFNWGLSSTRDPTNPKESQLLPMHLELKKKKKLTNFRQVKPSFILIKFWRESKITLKNHVGQACESPPAHEPSVSLGLFRWSPWFKKKGIWIQLGTPRQLKWCNQIIK